MKVEELLSVLKDSKKLEAEIKRLDDAASKYEAVLVKYREEQSKLILSRELLEKEKLELADTKKELQSYEARATRKLAEARQIQEAVRLAQDKLSKDTANLARERLVVKDLSDNYRAMSDALAHREREVAERESAALSKEKKIAELEESIRAYKSA